MKFPLAICSALIVFGTLSIASVTHAQDVPAQPWATDSTPPFDDVPADHWAQQATQKLRDMGIVIGYPNGTFNNSKVDELANLPADAWEYQAVDTLQRAGIVIGYSDGGYGGRPRMTRRDFTVAIARIIAAMNENSAKDKDLLAIQLDITNKLAQNPDALEAFKWLVIEFRPELAQLKQDVPKALAWLNALEKQSKDGDQER